MMNITKEEELAIKALKRVAKKWPETLWLFSADGTLCVMKSKPDGDHALNQFGSVDVDYEVDTIDIDNDGGDW